MGFNSSFKGLNRHVNVRYGIRNQPEGNVRYFCYEVLQLCRSI